MSDTPRTDIMASGNSDPSADEYADLLEFTRQLERESNQWKASHDNQVELKRILTDRPDLGDRAASMQKLLTQREALAAELQYFVDRVDAGTARSVTTYARFKAAIKANK